MEKLVMGLVGVAALFIVFFIADYASGETKEFPAVVVGKEYVAARTHTRPVYNSATKMTTIQTDHYPEKFILILEFDRDAYPRRVSSKRYATTGIGDKTTIAFRFGGITGNRY